MDIDFADRKLARANQACPQGERSAPVLTRSRGSRKDPILAMAMATALVLAVAACAPSHRPVTLAPTGGDLAAARPEAEGVPVIAPTEVQPQMRNRQAFLDQLFRRYPAMLTDGPDGVTIIRYRVDDQGRIHQVIQGPDSDSGGSGIAPAADEGARQDAQ